MGIKTTLLVTKDLALAIIIDKLTTLSERQLENILEEVISNGFYNFKVVEEDDFNENLSQEFPMPFLMDMSDVPEPNDAH